MTPSVWIPVAYGLVLAVAGMLQVWSLINRDKIAPIGEMIERIMHHRSTRIAVVFIWWWLGWHFVVA